MLILFKAGSETFSGYTSFEKTPWTLLGRQAINLISLLYSLGQRETTNLCESFSCTKNVCIYSDQVGWISNPWKHWFVRLQRQPPLRPPLLLHDLLVPRHRHGHCLLQGIQVPAHFDMLAHAVIWPIWPWYRCCKCSILLCRCKSRCCKCTNIFDAFPDAGVRWSRKRRWRWPQSICPPSTDMLGGPSPPIFPTLKSSDPKSLSLDQFSQRWNPVIQNHFRLKSWSDPKSFSVRCTEGGQVKDKQLEGEKFKLRPSVVVGTSWGEKSRMIF